MYRRAAHGIKSEQVSVNEGRVAHPAAAQHQGKGGRSSKRHGLLPLRRQPAPSHSSTVLLRAQHALSRRRRRCPGRRSASGKDRKAAAHMVGWRRLGALRSVSLGRRAQRSTTMHAKPPCNAAFPRGAHSSTPPPAARTVILIWSTKLTPVAYSVSSPTPMPNITQRPFVISAFLVHPSALPPGRKEGRAFSIRQPV